MKYCPNCKTYKESEEICEDCDTVLLDRATKQCPNCGKANRVDLKECIYCNHKFTKESYTFDDKEMSDDLNKAINNEKGKETGKFLGIGWVPFLIALFIGGMLYRTLTGRAMGFAESTVVGIISIFIFGIPIRMLIDKFKSTND